MLSFEDYVATKKFSQNLGEDLPWLGDEDIGVKGWIYNDTDYIYVSNHPDFGYLLVIGNGQWTSDSLDELEGILYEEHYVPEYRSS